MDARFEFLRSGGPASGTTANGAAPSLPLAYSYAHTNKAHASVRVHYWPARRAGVPSKFVVFFPGNPGIPDYYTPFLNALHAQLPDTHALMCTSHVGGDPSMPAPRRPLNLREQVDAKIELVSTLRSSLEAWAREEGVRPEDKPDVVIGAHSVGAWMTCEVAKALDVSATYLLFPTLGWIANSYNGWKLWPLFHRPVRTLVPYLSVLLRPILPFVGLPPPSRALVSSPTTLRHVLHLASSEMATIRAPQESWFRSQGKLPLGEGTHGVWTAKGMDGWVGADGPLIRGWLGKKRVLELEGVPHAFCLSEQHSRDVADVVAAWITVGEKKAAVEAAPPPKPLHGVGLDIAP